MHREVRQHVYNHTAHMLKPREVGNLPNMTELRSGSTKRLGKFAYAHTAPRWKNSFCKVEKQSFCNLPMIT